ncbi:MAG: hypothetical protein JWM27_1579 [Gemmatimonadetes bacterium]|nr:hypothetical protein [Gemmatimonadota bacterium]
MNEGRALDGRAERRREETVGPASKRPSACGKGAGMTRGSDPMARRTQAEIDPDDRPRRGGGPARGRAVPARSNPRLLPIQHG